MRKMKSARINWKLILIFSICGSLLGIGLVFVEPWSYNLEYQPTQYSINGKNVDDFTYLLQYSSYSNREEALSVLESTEYDLIIMEPYFDETSMWSKEEIDSIQKSPHDKILLAYLSIGEAENYRPYWNNSWDADADGVPDSGAPSWLDIENPEWEGNYKVHFWDPEWQALLFGSSNAVLDKIITNGYDGVYLDIIDAYAFYEATGMSEAEQLMVNFVSNISIYAKNITSNFLIVPQNAEELVEYVEYLDCIDGIGREEIMYQSHRKQSSEDLDYITSMLEIIIDVDKFVLEVEYVTIPRFKRIVYEFAAANNYLCYIGPKELDVIEYNWRFYPS